MAEALTVDAASAAAVDRDGETRNFEQDDTGVEAEWLFCGW